MTRTNLNSTVDDTFVDDSTIAGTDSGSTNAGRAAGGYSGRKSR